MLVNNWSLKALSSLGNLSPLLANVINTKHLISLYKCSALVCPVFLGVEHRFSSKFTSIIRKRNSFPPSDSILTISWLHLNFKADTPESIPESPRVLGTVMLQFRYSDSQGYF